ncbi:amidohydrolase family protein [Candidatus Sumerlaeota bacterium]|nr:amidohydrolase family protein [Candidatus Sumerlaeota bacterium]
MRKYVRDRNMGVDSPVPTQEVSNEEFIPRPQSKKQRHVEHLIGLRGEENAKKLGMSRRDFMRTSMGTATAFLAMNAVHGNQIDVEPEEALEPEAAADRFPKGEYFIIDDQGHYSSNYELGKDGPGGMGMGNLRAMKFMRDAGYDFAATAEGTSFHNFIKEMFFDSETSMLMLAGLEDYEEQRDEEGKVLQDWERSSLGMASWNMSRRKKDINAMAGGQRVLCQSNCAPNHYWDKARNRPDYPALYEQMEREVKLYGADSWKWYCHTDPAGSGTGYQLDDDWAAAFYEYSRKLGQKIFCVHKGFASMSRTMGQLANPKDVEKAALENPDFTFVIYHSGLKAIPGIPSDDAEQIRKSLEFDPTTGDFEWHRVLMDIKLRNPQIDNVYCELGSSFGLLALLDPLLCQHFMGKNIKYFGADHVVWGTDCIWWGSPQWMIDYMKRFQISDELCDKFGYAKITKEDKAKIFGENAARIWGIDLEEKRKALPLDAIQRFKESYQTAGGQPSNAAYGWVRAEA